MNTKTSLPSAHAELTYDVIVLGSGAAGFAAAVTASCRGLKVLLVEKTEAVGDFRWCSVAARYRPGPGCRALPARRTDAPLSERGDRQRLQPAIDRCLHRTRP